MKNLIKATVSTVSVGEVLVSVEKIDSHYGNDTIRLQENKALIALNELKGEEWVEAINNYINQANAITGEVEYLDVPCPDDACYPLWMVWRALVARVLKVDWQGIAQAPKDNKEWELLLDAVFVEDNGKQVAPRYINQGLLNRAVVRRIKW